MAKQIKGTHPQTPKLGLEMCLACAGLRAFTFRRFCVFGSVQVAELKAAKNIMFSMFFPGVLKTTVKTSNSIKARLESENGIRFRFAAFQASNTQTFAVT